ncbi:MAG: hypothetical protein NW200_06545 [Hyphomonadaceae bacterium]|nr:hypothetical protein [Hyphomonadaceae bacterium]
MPAHPNRAAPESEWVVTHGYEGPTRRRKKLWFGRKVRLADADVSHISAEGESTATLLRRVSLWGGLANAARDQRAAFLATLEALAEKGRRDHMPIWPDIVAAAARYVRAVGAQGRIDDPLLNDALQAAQRAHAESHQAEPQKAVVDRLDLAARAPH